MYSWSTIRCPEQIPRREFVHTCFDYGEECGQGATTIMSAVILGDSFVKFIGPDHSGALDRVYSRELAATVIVIMTKVIDDHKPSIMLSALQHTSNHAVIELERQICRLLNYEFPRHNIITRMWNICAQPADAVGRDLSLWFNCLALEICSKPFLLDANPFTLLMAITLLRRRNKLNADTSYRRISFVALMSAAAYDFELDLTQFVREYVNLKI